MAKAAGGEKAEGNKVDEMLAIVTSIKTEFLSRYDGVMGAIDNMRKKLKDCVEHVSQRRRCVSPMPKTRLKFYKLRWTHSKAKALEDKVLDLEAR